MGATNDPCRRLSDQPPSAEEPMGEEEIASERRNAEARARLGAPETLRVHLLLDARTAERDTLAVLLGAVVKHPSNEPYSRDLLARIDAALKGGGA